MELFHSRFSALHVSLRTIASFALAAALLFTAAPGQVSTLLADEDPPVFLGKWGSQGTGDGQFSHPWYVAGDSLGHIYVSENSNRVQKFDRDGTFIENWWGGPETPFGRPRGIAVDAEDNVYVADANNHNIQKFSDAGDFITTWGTEGESDGQFNYPHGIAVALDGSVYVADERNNRVQKFTWNEDEGVYQHANTWGGTEWGSELGQFSWPHGVATDANGNVYVADRNNHRIQKFDGTTWTLFAGPGGSGPGQFNYPRGVAVDSDGDVYVGDTDNHRIQKFNSAGEFLVSWGVQGPEDGQFSYPSGVWVRDNKDIYVADTGVGNHRIQVFGYYPTVDIELEAGWNMVSVPVQHPLSMATANLFAGTQAVYGWNRESQSYFTPSTIEVDHGYWVSVTSEQTITIPGTLQEDWSSTIMAGWNMVGSISQEMLLGDLVPDSGDPLLTSSVYWWAPSEREFVLLAETDVLEAGKAYWLASTDDCTVTLGPPEPD